MTFEISDDIGVVASLLGIPFRFQIVILGVIQFCSFWSKVPAGCAHLSLDRGTLGSAKALAIQDLTNLLALEFVWVKLCSQ